MRGNENISVLLVFSSVCCLALGGIFVKLSDLGPVNTGMYRILISLPILYPFVKRKFNKARINLKEKALLFFSGIFLGFDLLLWNISFSLTTVANANLLANLVPFTIIPLVFFLNGEKINKYFSFGLFITVVGLYILIKGKAPDRAGSLSGDFLAFSTSVFYGLFLFTVYKLRDKTDAMSIMFYSAFGSLAVLVPASFIIEGIEIPHGFKEWWPLVGLAIFSQILGQGGLSYCLGKIKPILASVLVLTQPVISAIYAWVIFKEALTLTEIVGIMIILTGIFLSKVSA